MSANNISLYIPHVFPNFDKEYITNAFKNIGEVSQIDFVGKQDRNGCVYNAVYVHFNKWYTNKKATTFYESVVDETKEARLCHDDPWYWIVLPNTAKKHISGERKPRIDLGEVNSISTSTMTSVKPMKRSYVDVIATPSVSNKSLDVSFDEVVKFEAEIEAEMDEIEEFLERQDANLVNIDARYVRQIEEENLNMAAEIDQLRMALIKLDMMYQSEAAKVRAFSAVDL
jgi:hypothetical protein